MFEHVALQLLSSKLAPYLKNLTDKQIKVSEAAARGR
jgi:hypothetical protein